MTRGAFGGRPGGRGRWSFTEVEVRALRDAYEALTRVGNESARPWAGGDRTPDGWDGLLDRAHHDLGLVVGHLEVLRG